ncbi:MAG: hypothetical protein M0011_07130 [Elusimicrobia bacterium]|nr:hypothetical protein [Elusimicrobiota bacterium]
MTLFRTAIHALLALSFTLPACAATATAEEVVQRNILLSETVTPLTPADARAIAAARGDKAIVIPAALVILAGAKVWNVIMDNRPSADLASAYASAIPGFDFNWNELSSWKKVTRKYRFTIDHWLQGRAVDIVYEISFYYGSISLPGSGKLRGHYLANFVIKPEVIDLKWGWKVALTAAMSDPMNIGTPEEPVAMLNADLKWQYAKPLSTKPNIGMNSVSVNGLGEMAEESYGDLAIAPVPAGEQRDYAPEVKWD